MSPAALENLAAFVLLAAGVGIPLFALTKGGPPERWAAGMMLTAWLLVLLLVELVGRGRPSVDLVSIPILATDFLLSVGLLILVLRYANLWLGVALLAQGAQLAAHAVFISSGEADRLTYMRISNLSSVALLLALLWGTAVAWRRRVVARRKPAPAHPA